MDASHRPRATSRSISTLAHPSLLRPRVCVPLISVVRPGWSRRLRMPIARVRRRRRSAGSGRLLRRRSDREHRDRPATRAVVRVMEHAPLRHAWSGCQPDGSLVAALVAERRAPTTTARSCDSSEGTAQRRSGQPPARSQEQTRQALARPARIRSTGKQVTAAALSRSKRTSVQQRSNWRRARALRTALPCPSLLK